MDIKISNMDYDRESKLYDMVLREIEKSAKIIDGIIIVTTFIIIAFFIYYMVEYFTVSTTTRKEDNNNLNVGFIKYTRNNKPPNTGWNPAPNNN